MKDHVATIFVAHSEISHSDETSLDRVIRIAIEQKVPFIMDAANNRIVLYDPSVEHINKLIRRGIVVQRKLNDFELQPCTIKVQD